MTDNTMETLINRLECYRYNNGQLSILYSWLGTKLFKSNSNIFNGFMDVKNHYVDLMTGTALIRYMNMHKVPQSSKVNNHLDAIISWIKCHPVSQYYDNNDARYTYGLYRVTRSCNHTVINEASQRDLFDFVTNLYPRYFYHKKLNLKTNKATPK